MINKQQNILNRIIEDIEKEQTFNILPFNKIWSIFNLKNGYVTRLNFNKIYNGLIDSLGRDSFKLPVGDFIGESCSNESE